MIWKTYRFLFAAILGAEAIAAGPSELDRPAWLPAGSQLYQLAGSLSSFDSPIHGKDLATVEGVAGQRSIRRHVVIVVWDGMRPDFVTEQNTPTLWKLANRGVVFRNHHAVYPSATNVNGTAMATGVYPGHSGIIANHEFRPAIDSRNVVDTADLNAVRKGDEVSENKYVAVPTIAQLVRQAGGRTVIASAKTIGLLLDRQVDEQSVVFASASPLGKGERIEVRGSELRSGEKGETLTLPCPLRRERQRNAGSENSIEYACPKDCVTLFAGESLPDEAIEPIAAALGPFPKHHLQQDAWTAKAMVELLWKENVAAFSVLWLGEPDLTQHETAPGAPAALAAIKSSDENLARVLAGLEQHHVLETTDIFVVSDHGFSTIERAVDLRKILKDAGFDAVTQFADQPKPGQIIMVGNGGSVLFYVVGHQGALIHRLVELLQQSDFAGVIFTRKKMEGTFAFDVAKIDVEHAPDVEMAFHWEDKKSQFGVPGMIDADWQREAGKGTHATLSRFDMHNTLIAAGPDFRSAFVDDLPTGNIDLAPTILRILRVEPPSVIDGRVLTEAMVEGARDNAKSDTQTVEATKRYLSGTWRQTLKISRVGSTIYFDEGNGKLTP